jgi:hypothetical protein
MHVGTFELRKRSVSIEVDREPDVERVGCKQKFPHIKFRQKDVENHRSVESGTNLF